MKACNEILAHQLAPRNMLKRSYHHHNGIGNIIRIVEAKNGGGIQ